MMVQKKTPLSIAKANKINLVFRETSIIKTPTKKKEGIFS